MAQFVAHAHSLVLWHMQTIFTCPASLTYASFRPSRGDVSLNHTRHNIIEPLYDRLPIYTTRDCHATMPGCAACNVSKKRCPGGVRGCLVYQEKKEKQEVMAREGRGEKKGGGPAPRVKSPPQKQVISAEPRRTQQPVTAGQAPTFTQILNAPRAAPPAVNDARIWKESSAVQALRDFPEADQQPGACAECHEPLNAHYFGCSHYVSR
ncbi:hypothetical protein DOTSEDRAFT_69754 [Dothistroma septosporum NZE10]|uniref:Uncharacterized protein n=1 Tax=Dothistroma septosporum (strain NZE10 / CBS 128990) TaxID=675120 RepID=N1PZV5_DOTSN|nr:hypothetical protein DOTSEDRAFT_69754 [Dothistroma septosporum NZE10]